eukprot:1175377-Prorocentrum_minimum.AAC.1
MLLSLCTLVLAWGVECILAVIGTGGPDDFLDLFEEMCLKKKCMPCQIVWRESTHQHFPGTLGGLYVKPDPKCRYEQNTGRGFVSRA